MAVSSSSVYSKGSLLGSDKEWYHGELTKAKAEQALTASGSDCFLIRESRGNLVLSLIHHGQLHHINIKYGPGWYELESGSSAQYSFTELEELISHYSSIAISDVMKIKLGVACQKENAKSLGDSIQPFQHHIHILTDKREPTDLTRYNWYHGDMSQEQAEYALSEAINNIFLVRHWADNLILSKRINGWSSHDTIYRSPEGYRLEARERLFETVPEMIMHYLQFPIDSKCGHVLGNACNRIRPGTQLKTTNTSNSLFKKANNTSKVSWQRCADLPIAISAPQVVRIGDKVYVGGGNRKIGSSCDVFQYDLSEDTWTPLPDCPTSHHSITTLDGELIAIGGIMNKVATNSTYTFRGSTWNTVIPPMPTPRFFLSTTSHDNIIIAAGGITHICKSGEQLRTDSVEIYITRDKQWYRTKRLPFPDILFSISIISGKCYILGSSTSMVMTSTLSALIENALPADSAQQKVLTWKRLKDMHPITYASPVEVDGKLVAMGGSSETRLRCGTKFISTYDFATDAWVECRGAELPVPLYKAGVLKLEKNKVMVIGGQPKVQQLSAAVYIGTFDHAGEQ